MFERCLPLIIVLTILLSAGTLLAQEEHNPSGAPEGWPEPIHDAKTNSFVLFDQLEYRDFDGTGAFGWDLVSWIGGDSDRLWIESEGQALTDGTDGEIERLDVLYGHLIAPFWDIQAGLSYQRIWGSDPSSGRVSAVIGLQGLAPYTFEVDTNFRLSEDGDISADLQATYDLLITQRLVLQLRVETLYAFQTVEEFGVGQGLNYLGTSLRLRYEIRRELAPYVGLTWSRSYGETADLAKAKGNDPVDTAVVAGLRLWF